MSETTTAPARQTWAAGDFPRMGAELAIVGEQLCEAIPLHAGDCVLDVATASGNTAISAARRRAIVTGIDLVPALLGYASNRARAEGFEIDFQEGNAMALAFADASFDVVLSTFGAIFPPDPHKTSAEMARVCRPGGKIGIATWPPDSMLGKLFLLLAPYSAPGSRVGAPIEWGSRDNIEDRLSPHVKDLRIERKEVRFRALSARHWVEFMRTYFGPAIEAFAYSTDPAAQQALAQEMEALIKHHNRATNGTALGASDYLEIVATRRG